MIPIRTARELQALDQRTIQEEEISAWDLMERAVDAFSETLMQGLDFDRVCICCGPGNNGGDGLGTARKLIEAGKEVQVYVSSNTIGTPEYSRNLEMLSELIDLDYFEDGIEIEAPLVIDALFGYGLNRKIEGFYSDIVQEMNASGAYIVSVDIPSGMPAEPDFKLDEYSVVKADQVLTFHCPKLSMILPYAGNFCPGFDILDIGLHDDLDASFYFIAEEDISSVLKDPERFTHKHKRGHALIAGGSAGKTGAPILATEAALRTGCGLVHALIPTEAVLPLQIRVTEAMYEVSGDLYIKSLQTELEPTAIGMGPGMGNAPETREAIIRALELGTPLIFDADAIRILADSGHMNDVPAESIFTPHEGEFRAMVGSWQTDTEKLDKLRQLSNDLGSVIVLKGAYTCIAFQGKVYVNSSGNPAMATAGSGDVLLGVITSLRAQGYSALESAVIGVYIHGLAAEIYLEQTGSSTLLASDISACLGKALFQLQS